MCRSLRRPAPAGPELGAAEITTIRQLLQTPALRQFVKFCIIGATSTVIDVGLLNLLVRPNFVIAGGLHWIPAQVISFGIAVANGYLWNSMWTFKGLGSDTRRVQFLKFLIVNIVGLLLNVTVMKAVFFTVHPELIHHGNPSQVLLNVAKAIAIVIVSLWNFNANKRWTFRDSKPGQQAGQS